MTDNDEEELDRLVAEYLAALDEPIRVPEDVLEAIRNHVHKYDIPVFKLGHHGGTIPLTFKCECGKWESIKP